MLEFFVYSLPHIVGELFVDLYMRGYLSLLLLFGLSLGQTFPPITVEEDSNEVIAEEKSILNKHNISVGMFDDRTGLSLIGYTYNIKQTTMDEYFIGAGTMFLAFTGTLGWKHYYKKSRLSTSSVLCGQYIAHIGFMGFLPTASFTIEYDVVERTQVKLGVMGLMLLGGTSSEDGSDVGGDVGVLPFLGLNFRF